MTKTLKNLIESYQKGELSTPNIQVIDKIFSDEMINLPDDVLLDLTFSRAFFEKSRLNEDKILQWKLWFKLFQRLFFRKLSFFKDSFSRNGIFEMYFQRLLIYGLHIRR